MSKLVQAGLAAFLIQIVFGFVFYELLMAEQFAVWEAEVARAEPMLAIGALGILIFCFAMAAIYPKGYQGGDPLQEGARFGLMIGAILVGFVTMYYSYYELQLAGVVTDAVFNVLLLVVIGATIGKIYGTEAGS